MICLTGNTSLLIVVNETDIITTREQIRYPVRTIPLSEITSEYGYSRYFKSLGYNPETGRFVPVGIEHPRLSGLDVEITTVNYSRVDRIGDQIKSSPHALHCCGQQKLWLANGNKVAAQDLEANMVLLDCDLAREDSLPDTYLIVDDIQTGIHKADVFAFTVPLTHSFAISSGAVLTH